MYFLYLYPQNNEDRAICGLISAVGLITYLIYSAFTFVQCQIYNTNLNHQNEKVEELAHRIWHGKYTVEEITVSDDDQSSYPKLPVYYDVSFVVWSKRVKGVQENGELLNLPNKMDVLHWHEETFELPAESELLYSSTHIENQAFILNKNIIGLQFHLEAVSVDIASMVAFDLDFINDTIFKEQTPSKIFSKGKENDNSEVLFSILDYLVTPSKINGGSNE